MTSLEAMAEVQGFLNEGNIAGAQAAVVAIESEGSVLPSSVFEKVLRRAVVENAVLPFYADFCQRAFGKQVFVNIVWDCVAAA